MQIKILPLTGLLLAVAFSVGAQNLSAYKSKLEQPDPTYRTRVEITEHGDAATAVRSMQGRGGGSEVLGYRVRIFFDNSQHAGDMANQALRRFREIYPYIPAQIVYKAPYFRVTVGNCLTADEAQILLGKIKGAFPLAFPLQESISLEAFGQAAPPEEASPAASAAQ